MYVLLNLKGSTFENVAIWDPVDGFNQYGNMTFANGTTVQVLGPGDPNADPSEAEHQADCSEYLFNVEGATVTDTVVTSATETVSETVTSVSVSTETPGFGILLALMSMFLAIPILRRKN